MVHIEPNPHLTRCERSVLNCISEGMSSKQTADKLCVSKRTVDFHLGSIYTKLSVNNRIQAINVARNLGLLVVA